MVLRMLDTGDQGTEEIAGADIIITISYVGWTLQKCLPPVHVRFFKSGVFFEDPIQVWQYFRSVLAKSIRQNAPFPCFFFLFIDIPTKEIMAQFMLIYPFKIV